MEQRRLGTQRPGRLVDRPRHSDVGPRYRRTRGRRSADGVRRGGWLAARHRRRLRVWRQRAGDRPIAHEGGRSGRRRDRDKGGCGRYPTNDPMDAVATCRVATCCKHSTTLSTGWPSTTSTCGSCTAGTRRHRSTKRCRRSISRSPLGARATSGLSNCSGWQTAKAAGWQAAWPGRVPLVSTQVEYSLLERGVEREVVPAALDAGMSILAWSPLGRGVLTGKYRTGIPADSRAASDHLAGFVEPYLDEAHARVVQAVCTAAEGLGVSPLATALAWVRDQPGVAAPLVGARTAAQLLGILAESDVVLPPEIRDALDDVSAPAMGYPERGPGQD